jgi:hypothetical protein
VKTWNRITAEIIRTLDFAMYVDVFTSKIEEVLRRASNDEKANWRARGLLLVEVKRKNLSKDGQRHVTGFRN